MKAINKTKLQLILCFSIMFGTIYSNPLTNLNGTDPARKLKEADVCLVINGKFLKSLKGSTKTYTVLLIQENTVVETKTIKCGSTFKFNCKKANWYAIKIIGEGCVPKIYSINTNLPKNADDIIYSLDFNASEPITEYESTLMDDDALDFPVTVFEFDKKLEAFNYNEEYTSNIMKKLFEKITPESENL